MALNFQDCWQRACARARVNSSQATVATLAQDLTNDYYEDLVNLCPEAPWARKQYRFTTLPALTGSLATWTNGSTGVSIEASEALTAGQKTAYVGARIHNPAEPESYLVSAIPTTTTFTLDTAYIGASTVATGGWELFQDLYAVPNDYSDFVVLAATVGPPALPFKGEVELRELGYVQQSPGTPVQWSLVYTAGVPSIMFDPPPAEQNIYTLNYVQKITRLTGTGAFLVPDEGIQAILFIVAGDLAAMLREDTTLGNHLRGIGQGKWDKLVNKFGPQRARPSFKLPRSLRPWQSRVSRVATGSHVADADQWARES